MPANPVSLEDLTVDCLTENVWAFVANLPVQIPKGEPPTHHSVGWRRKIAQKLSPKAKEHVHKIPEMEHKEGTQNPTFHPFFRQSVKFEPMKDSKDAEEEAKTEEMGLIEIGIESDRVDDAGKNSGFIPLPASIGDKLIRRVEEKGLLDDRTLPLFQKKYTDLEKVHLSNKCALSSTAGLKVLSEHNLKELGFRYVRNFDLSEVALSCINQKSKKETLKVLDLTGSLKATKGGDGSKRNPQECQMSATVSVLVDFTQLRVLKVGVTKFDDPSLAIVCDNLKNLEVLDISGTDVFNIDPIRKLQELRAVVLHRIRDHS